MFPDYSYKSLAAVNETKNIWATKNSIDQFAELFTFFVERVR